MFSSILTIVGVVAAAVVALIILVVLIVKSFYIKVPQGTALIVNTLSSIPKVSFTGALVYPVIYKKEFMKISLITLEIDRRGSEGLICRDNIRADITVAFYLKVNATQDDVLKVAKSVGADRASDHAAVATLFNAKFSEALKTAGKKFDFEELFSDRKRFRDSIIEAIGDDLNGYSLEDAAIDYLDQTPIEHLKNTNIMDAEGIRKIVERTSTEIVKTNELDRDKDLAITKKNVETQEATLALERQRADAENRQKREVETTKAREEAETKKVQAEELAKSEIARKQAEQEIGKAEINTQRELDVTELNKKRVLVEQEEGVTQAQQEAIVKREREVELQRIDKEKALEAERTAIANIIRDRVAVERTVAKEEEAIKEVRAVSEADRAKQVSVLEAQAEAERDLVRQVKQAEADAETSKHKSIEINNMAQAELEAAAKKAESQKRLAEGVQAERAAPGLADARVREVQAAVREKEGLIEAKLTAERGIAEAKAVEEKGLAEAKIIEFKADANQKQGLAEAKVQMELMLSTAKGKEEQGLADARITEAAAVAKEKEGLVDAKVMEEKLSAQARGEDQLGTVKAKVNREVGDADAEVLLKRMRAEATGLAEKFTAINALSDNARAHEEFRLQIDKAFEQSLAAIAANKDIAKEQAEVLAAGLAKTKIDVVGGEGEFFEKFSKALAVGKSLDGFVNSSSVAQGAIQQILSATSDRIASKPETKKAPQVDAE
ncbi:hypothetical protein DKL61_07310 [Gammaproteobacteria bacterium ESL0073]|nr:hypothetical protein DKL61_07310 [Gammaproteobacteria bacterium ESL0073]